MALLFLAQEGRDTHAGTDFRQRIEQSEADAEEEAGLDINLATPHTEGGEKQIAKKNQIDFALALALALFPTLRVWGC